MNRLLSSLRVSEAITVLSRAAILFLVLPLLILAVCFMTHALMLMLSTAVLLGSPHALTIFRTELKFVQSFFSLIFALSHFSKSVTYLTIAAAIFLAAVFRLRRGGHAPI